MIALDKLNPDADEFSDEELETFAKVILMAKDIEQNSVLMRHVEAVMRKQKKKITSLEDIRRVQAEKNLSE